MEEKTKKVNELKLSKYVSSYPFLDKYFNFTGILLAKNLSQRKFEFFNYFFK